MTLFDQNSLLLVSAGVLGRQPEEGLMVRLKVLAEPGRVLAVLVAGAPVPVFPALHGAPGVPDQQQHLHVGLLHQGLGEVQP